MARKARHPSRAVDGTCGVGLRPQAVRDIALVAHRPEAVDHEHPSPVLAGSVRARSSAGAWAPAGRPVPVWRGRPGGRLLRLCEGRPDAALHGLGRGHLAAGRPWDRRALPLGSALVAGHPHRASSSSTESCSSASIPCRSGAWWVSRRATWPRSSWALCCCGGSSARARRSIAGSRSAGCSRPWRSRRRSARPWGWCRCWPVESSPRVRHPCSGGRGGSATSPAHWSWCLWCSRGPAIPALRGGACGPPKVPCCSLLWRPSVRSPCPPASPSPMWSSPR